MSHATVNLNGYLKSYAWAQARLELEDGSTFSNELISPNQVSQNSMRLMFQWFNQRAHFLKGNLEIHYELRPSYFSDRAPCGASSTSATDLITSNARGSSLYRLSDIKADLNPGCNHLRVGQNLDRFNYQLNAESGDLILGRQPISFGSARFINPTDIFLPFNLQALDQEYRVGIDAIRYRADMGQLSEVDVGIVVGDEAEKENSAVFLRGKTSYNSQDIEAIWIGLDHAWLLGAGIERAFGDLGFWLEAAYLDWQTQGEKPYIRMSSGVDYAFSDSITALVEYHFNGAGASSVEAYLSSLENLAYQRVGVFLLGRHYLIPSVSWTLSPLVQWTTTGFINLSDTSVFFNTAVVCNWTDNLYSDFGLYWMQGDKPRFDAMNSSLVLGSEFGSIPSSLYASLRYYF